MYFWFMFADGYEVAAKGFDRNELKRLELQHGRLLGKRAA